MKVYYTCGACYLRQARDTADLATDDEDLKFKIMQHVLSFLAEEFDENLQSNSTGTRIQRYIKKVTGCDDPYKAEKIESNRIALNVLPKVKEILKDDDSLETFVKVAIVGNIIDFGAYGLDADWEDMINDGLKKELVINDIDAFEDALNKYDDVLYLVDNTGEIVFDKLLIEKIKSYGVNVTVAVKEKPILNDACMEEALEVGLDEVADIISTGTDSVGIVESMVSDEFLEYFKKSPFVISKGMGNYEGITEMDLDGQDVFVLLAVKCPAISNHSGVDVGSHILHKLS
ncbi:MAG: ARMT1-like domain-containing protein [archaeon]|nr:ARMT1-like domain-containing protein [archaeon]